MAMTVGVDRELGAPAPPVAPKVDRRRQVLLLLGTVTASVTFQAGLIPPGGLWSERGARMGGDASLDTTYPERSLMFFYCNAYAFVASLVMVLLLIITKNPVAVISIQRINFYALRVVLTVGLLCLIGAYVGMSRLSNSLSADAIGAYAVVLYIAIQITKRLCRPVAVKISPSSVQLSPEKRSKLLPSKKKKKYLLKVEQKQQNLISGQGAVDAYQILKKSRIHMLLLGTLAASVTYQAGLNGIWQGEVHYASGDHRILHDKSHLVFFCCNASAFVVSLAIVVILLLSSVFSSQEIKYYRALEVAVTVDLFCLTGAYVAIHVANDVVVFLLELLLGWAILRQRLRQQMGPLSPHLLALSRYYLPNWLKKLFGLSTDGQAEEEEVWDEEEEEEEEDDYESEEEEEEEESAVDMELKLDHWYNLLLMLAILTAILEYHAIASRPADNLVNYQRLAFSYCKSTVFIASLSIIAMLWNRKFPAARSLRWHAMRVCLILDVIGLTGVFAARGYWKISTIDVFVLALAVVLCIAFHVVSSISGMPRARGLVHSLLMKLGLCRRDSALVLGLAGPADPVQDDATQHDYEVGMTGGTNEEPLAVEIASTILGGAVTLSVAVPVMHIVATPVKLLVGIIIATIGVGLWRRSLARLLRAIASVLQRHHQGTTSPTAGSSPTPPNNGLCKLIHMLCSETWMWIIILVIWVPSLRDKLKLKFKMSRILAVLGQWLPTPEHDVRTPTLSATAGTAASTTTTATLVTPGTATSTVVGTPIMAAAPGRIPITADASSGNPITADASGTSMGRGIQPLVEPRPRRNRRPNSRLIGPDWINY